MTFLFVYSYSNLYTLINSQIGKHRTVFATFRQEYSTEPVFPLYVFSINKNNPVTLSPILNEEEISNAFQYSFEMGFINKKIIDVQELGRRYEQFYLSIIDKENISCIVTHNTGYGFQVIAHLLAKKIGIKSIITENGYFRPLTMTVEKNGVNALSCMKDWKCSDEVTVQEKMEFQDFYKKYKNIPSHHHLTYSIFKEIKQRFHYNRYDAELYHHHWIHRTKKEISNLFRPKISRSQLNSKRFFIFFISSVYDPQLPIPSSQYINSICETVLESFYEFKKENTDVVLVFKEHPLDSKRIILDYQDKLRNYEDVFFTTEESQWLIRHSAGVITINSGAGIEALCEYKPLLCLGDSLYSHSDIAITVENPNNIEEVLKGLQVLITTVPNSDCIENYLTRLFYSTQIFIKSSNSFSRFKDLNFFDRAVQLLVQ